jgi:hypothetical protein
MVTQNEDRNGNSPELDAAIQAAKRARLIENLFGSCCVGLGYFMLTLFFQLLGRLIEPHPHHSSISWADG